MPKTERVAALQMCSTAEVPHNLRVAEELIKQAVASGAKLVLLPENFAHMPNRESERRAVAETDGSGPIQDFLANQANRHNVFLVGGSVPLVSPNSEKVFASSLCYGPDGDRAARYDKIHLFDVAVPGSKSYAESDGIEHGATHDNSGLIETPWGIFAMTICYDLRFPELYRRNPETEITAFLVPAAFTFDTGKAHWEILLRARAVENLAYIVGSGQHGTHTNGRSTWGHSMIVDPWGKILAIQPEGDGAIVATLDLAKQKELRQGFPCLQHRRV